MDPLHSIFLVSFPGATIAPGEVTSVTPPGEMIIGQPVEVAARWPIGALSCSVLSAPAGSTAAFAGGRFVPDRPGVYTFRLANGSALILHRRVAFPAEALEHPMVADRNWPRRAPYSSVPIDLRSDEQRRIVLRKIASGGLGPIDDAAFASLTPERPLPVGLDASRFGS